MKRRLVIYTTDAGKDLDWIYDAIAGAGSPVTASRYEQAIRAFCDGLDHASERAAATTFAAASASLGSGGASRSPSPWRKGAS